MKFGQNMDWDGRYDDLEGQGHRSKVKITRSKNCYFRYHLSALQVFFEVKGHMGQGQRPHGSKSNVKLEGRGQRQGHRVKM